MKQYLYATLALLLASGAAATVSKSVKLTPRDVLELRASDSVGYRHGGKKLTRSAVTAPSPYIFIEDFENVANTDPYDLPEGWTTLSTPDHKESRWLGASLGVPGSDQPLPGTSGTKYAVLMGQDYSIDSWMFTPKLHMEAGKIYDIYFSVYKPQAASNTVTTFSVSVGDAPAPESMEMELMTEGRSMNNWNIYNRSFKPEQTGDYYIGFHAEAGSRSYLTAVDDVMVTEACPRVYAPADLIFPEKTSLEDEAVAVLSMYNLGSGVMTLEAGECSPELEFVDLPASVNGRKPFDVTVRFTSKQPGDYEGFVTLLTNDPLNPEVKIPCRGRVTESVKSSYWYEDFEKGTPDGWDLTEFYFHPSKGINGSRCLENWTLYTSDIITHYIEMGSNPVIGFSYKAQQYDISGVNPSMPPTKPEFVKINVYVSDDFGKSFKRVYRIAPEDGDMVHTLSYDYANVRIPVPEFKDKLCQVKIEVEKSLYFGTDDYGILIDNVEIGTCNGKDLSATTLFGPGIIKAGKKASYTFNFRNAGTEEVASSDYSISLLDDKGTILASAAGVALGKGEDGSVTMDWTPEETGSRRVYAMIDFTGDENKDNNMTSSRQIGVIKNPIVASAPYAPQNMGFSIQTPVNYYYKNCAVQTLYYANDINASDGVLQSIAFEIKNDADFISPAIDVWVGETDRMNFNDGEFVDPSTLTKVYSGPVDIPAGTGSFDIPFTQPYEWGGKNLVVYMVKNASNFYHYKMFAATKEDRLNGCTIGLFTDDATIDPMHPGKGELNNEVAIADFYWVKSDKYGSLEGTVTDEEGPVANAKVLLEGTSYFSVTDAKGHYSFDRISEGDVKLSVEAYGHDSLNGVKAAVNKNTTAEKDITITISPRHTVNFKVSDSAGNPLVGVAGRLVGYANYRAISDAEGVMSFPQVFGHEEAYDFSIEQNGYEPHYSDLQINSDINSEVKLNELLNTPTALVLTPENDRLALTWEAPRDEFGYDNGTYVEKLGFDTGNKTSLIGVAFNNNAVVEEVSWFTNNTNNPHPTVNIYILALDQNGRPTSNILFGVEGAPNVDGEWNSFKLPDPVKAPNGFYVGVSCDGGFLGLGVGDLRAENGLRPGQFWTSSEFTFQAQPGTDVQDGLWVDNYGTANCNYVPMIRVKGIDNGYIDHVDYSPVAIDWFKHAPAKAEAFIRNTPTYRIAIDGTTVAEGIEDTKCSIEMPASGHHTVSLFACYPSGESTPVESILSSGGVDNVTQVIPAIGPNPFSSFIEIKGWEDVKEFTLVSINGSKVVSIAVGESRINLPTLPSGVYIAIMTMYNGERITTKLIAK